MEFFLFIFVIYTICNIIYTIYNKDGMGTD